MTQIEQQKAAKKFADDWKDKGDEKQESQRFWIDLLQNVLGVENPAKYIEFEKRVQLSHTSYIDAYIAETKVLIEQKGIKIDLHKAYEQSDGQVLTPFQQAKRYVGEMKASEKPRWIVVCNFAEFLVYDLEEPNAEPQQILLKDLEKDYYCLRFLVDQKNENIRPEEEISIQAGKLVGKLYDAISPEYKNPDENSFRSLNILCVRIVFCLYAEDAGLFETRTSFEDYIKSFNLPNLRIGIINLFKALDTKIEDRDKYDESLNSFPYVNGGLFRDEQIEIPNFTQEIVDVIVNHCAPFNWSEISPTIFGAVFESTLNPETRRKGGMHYTSIQNIHKVIDPLFMDDLNAEFEEICATKAAKQKAEKLHEFQKKLGSLTFLDPACGSGNFLTETYLSLRRLENKVISILNKGERAFGFDEFIKVHISQFYGIEINDFAVTVAKTALWIAESQMIAETESILSQNIDFLPLTTNAFIVEGNALKLDWSTLQPSLNNENFASQNSRANGQQPLFSGFTTQTDGTKHEYDYIMGNPPFVGASMMNAQQKKEATDIFGKIHLSNSIDYVGAWYYKAADLIKGKNTKVAFVSTNSITQGEQVFPLWNSLLQKGLCIDFAYRTFKWDSESSEKAAVHCVIVGFSCKDSSLASTSLSNRSNRSLSGVEGNNKIIFNADGTFTEAKNINPYLIDAPNVLIESHGGTPLCDIPKMTLGNKPTDDGNFIFSEAEYNDFVAKYPKEAHLLHHYVGAKDFLNNDEVRYCLWLKDVNPTEFSKNKEIMRRLDAIKAFREKSSAEPTRKSALTPWKFFSTPQTDKPYLIVPEVSSERRLYIPIGFMQPEIIAANTCLIVSDATLYHFGVLTSLVHMAWMRVAAGRLKSDYRYSSAMVYNTFPWCNATDEQKTKIGKTAQAILDARAKYEGTTLAQLYGEHQYLYPELAKAHRENDKAVMQAYGFDAKMSESEIVAELFKLYEKLTAK